MTYFITIAGRRWPVETTFKAGKDALGWDQSQARTWDAINRHTALTALAAAALAAETAGRAAAALEGPGAGDEQPTRTPAAISAQAASAEPVLRAGGMRIPVRRTPRYRLPAPC